MFYIKVSINQFTGEMNIPLKKSVNVNPLPFLKPT